MNTATELSRPGVSPTVPMPRIRAEPLASLPVEDTSRDGASWFSSRMSLVPLCCNCSELTAETAIGTSDKTCSRPCAVTTIILSLKAPLPLSACSPSVSDCAYTGEDAIAANANMQVDSRKPTFIIYSPIVNYYFCHSIISDCLAFTNDNQIACDF